MANRHGGYRRPRNPAPASGPGKLSRRTDGGPGQKLMAPTGMPYGDQGNLLAQERTAPMSQADNIPAMDISAPSTGGQAATAQQAPPLTMPDFGRPTERPSEPITSGVDIGAGPGSEALPVQAQPQYQQMGPFAQRLSQISAADMTGALASVYQFARDLGA